MLLDHDKFVVKSTSKKFSWKKSYDIVDGDTGQSLGSARDVTGFVASLLGATHIDVREGANNALLFSVKSTGLIFKGRLPRRSAGLRVRMCVPVGTLERIEPSCALPILISVPPPFSLTLPET